MDFALDDDAAPQACAQSHPHQVVVAFAGSEPRFAQGKAIGVVVLEYRQAKTFLNSLFHRKTVE